MITPKFVYKIEMFYDVKICSWIFEQIELFRHHNMRISWMPNFVFEIAEWKALNLAINWIISSVIRVRLSVFILIHLPLALDLHFDV